MTMVLAPPPHFDHPYHGQVIEQVLPQAEVQKLCSQMAVGNLRVEVDGCAAMGHDTKTGKKVCVIVMIKGPSEQALRRHETAHCNGWNQTHSN